jgi:hypothetical protein
MLIEPDYRGHRIEVFAIEVAGGRWNATLRVRRLFTEEPPHVETVMCRKPTASLAETRAMVLARRWVDLRGG